MSPAPIYPTALEQIDTKTLRINWNDGQMRVYLVRDLRLACGCAHCKDEWTGKPLIDSSLVPPDVVPKKITPVGRYALSIHWSDGHDTGIYPFDVLKTLGTDATASK